MLTISWTSKLGSIRKIGGSKMVWKKNTLSSPPTSPVFNLMSSLSRGTGNGDDDTQKTCLFFIIAIAAIWGGGGRYGIFMKQTIKNPRINSTGYHLGNTQGLKTTRKNKVQASRFLFGGGGVRRMLYQKKQNIFDENTFSLNRNNSLATSRQIWVLPVEALPHWWSGE